MTWLINPYRFGSGNPDPYWANVIFYLGMGAPGSNPTDVSPQAWPITEVGAGMDFVADAGPVAGMPAWLIRRTNTAQSIVNQLTADLSTVSLSGDYTIEVWARAAQKSGNYNTIFAWAGRSVNTNTAGDYQRGFAVQFPGVPAGTFNRNGAFQGESLVPGTWFHVCLERQSGLVRFYLNGQPWDATMAGDAGSLTGILRIGGGTSMSGGATENDWSGYIGPVRITGGVARYGGTPFVPGFTPDGWMTATPPTFLTKKWARISWTSLNGQSQARFVEIEMRETSGGSTINVSKSAVPTYASSSGSANNAFNWNFDKLSTSCSLTVPGTISVDLKEAFAIRHLRLMAGLSATPACPVTFTLDYSDDNSAWTTALTVTGESGWLRYEARAYHVPAVGAHRYWRLSVTAATPSTTAEIMQIGLAESAHGPNLAQSSRAWGTAYDGNNNTPHQPAFDGTTSGGSNSRIYYYQGWIGQRLLTPLTSLDEIRIWTVAGEQAYTPNTGKVETSHDGQRWQTEWSWSGLTWTSGEAKVITKP